MRTQPDMTIPVLVNGIERNRFVTIFYQVLLRRFTIVLP